jgi:hypothetical protein
MSDFHVLEQSRLKDRVQVAFHFDVPDVQNAASRNLADAYIDMLDQHWEPYFTGHTRPVSQVPRLQVTHPTEYSALANGTKIERVESVEFDASLTNGEKLTLIQNRWTALNGLIPDELSSVLGFYGYSADVP